MRRATVRVFALLASLSVLVSPSVLADPSSTATISSLSGQVQYKNPGDTDWQSASQGTVLMEGAKIFVGENSECTLTLGNNSKSVTKIKEETRAILSSLGDDLKIDLSSGEIFSLFKRSDSRSTFKISSPTAVAAVRGTAFSFAAEGIGSDMNNTVQVYEHTVALAPMDAQDKEILVNEGQGVVLGGDGVVEKQFEVSADDLRSAHEFMNQAADFLPKELVAADPVQTQEARTEEAPSDNDDKNMGGGNPPSGNPPAGPGDGPGNGPGDGPGANRFDSAMDGLMQGMAGESEMSQDNAFAPGSMTQMVSNLTDLSHGMTGVGGAALAPGSQGTPGGNFDPGAFRDALKGALHESPQFQNQTPEMQERWTAYVDQYIGYIDQQTSHGPTGPMPGDNIYDSINRDRGPLGPGGPSLPGPREGPYPGGPMPDPYSYPEIGCSSGGPCVPPPPMPNPMEYINHESMYAPPPDRQTIMDFFNRLRDNYFEYRAAHAGDMSGYFGNEQITPFSFVYDGTGYSGSIKYTPLANIAPETPDPNYHVHDSNFMIHLDNVQVYNAPEGSGTLMAQPSEDHPDSILEVLVPDPSP